MSSGTMQYTTVDRIFNKIDRDLGFKINEGDAIEWTGEALDAIGAVRQYEEAVCFVEVANHQIVLPAGFHSIIQIARNNCFVKGEIDTMCTPLSVAPVVPSDNPLVEKCNIPIVIDCNGQPLQDYELAYYRPFFDLRYEYSNWIGSTPYKNCFTPVALSTHTFFNSLVCREADSALYSTSKDEYTIILGKMVRFSFEKGQVALSYLRQVLDEETGYPMIPDNYSFVTAIVKYITYKISERNFYNNRQGSESRVQKAESDWQWYCKQAGAYAMMLKGIDEHENNMKQRNYLIPQHNRYSGFFGNLAQAEDRTGLHGTSHNQFRGI